MKGCIILLTMTFLSLAACQLTSETENPTVQAKETPSHQKNNTLVCIEDKNSKTRTFSTLKEYQDNTFSFNPNSTTYQGNIVQFTTSKPIKRLQENSFISLGSESIMKMSLRNIQLQYLDPGTFHQLSCVQELDLSHNNLRNLSGGVFEGLQTIKELDLSFNQLQGIPANGLAFLAIRSIRILNLSNNQINVLDRSSFLTLLNLTVLDLGHNRIQTLDPRVFNFLEGLRKLYINNNLLEEISAEKWMGLNNLTDLDISDNYIRSFDMTEHFSFNQLTTLDLSCNRLSHFNVQNLRNVLPKLSVLDISDNNWLCEDLEIIEEKLKEFRVSLLKPVSCSNVIITSTKRTPTTETPLNPGANSGFLNSVTKIEEDIQDLRSILVTMLILFVFYLVAQLGVRLGVYRRCYDRFRSRRDGLYLDDNEGENLNLN